MGAFRTFLAWQTLGHARRTARNSAVTARATTDLATLARDQDLRARGWIGPAAPPWERRAAVDTLNAQAYARAAIVDEANGARPSPYWIPVGIGVVGIGIVALLLAIVFIGARGSGGPALPGILLLMAVFVAAAVVAAVLVRHYEARRDAVLADAIEVDGMCLWCGAAAPHMLEGVPTPPRVYHAPAIRAALR